MNASPDDLRTHLADPRPAPLPPAPVCHCGTDAIRHQAAAIRRRAADEAYRALAFVSAAVWTFGTLFYFILVAAPAERPVFPAMQGMMGSLVLAAIPWLFRRQLTDWLAARRRQDRPLAE